MAKGVKLTKEEHKIIKNLLEKGSTQAEIAKVMNMSTTTVSMVNTTNSYEGYLAKRKAADSKKEGKKTQHGRTRGAVCVWGGEKADVKVKTEQIKMDTKMGTDIEEPQLYYCTKIILDRLKKTEDELKELKEKMDRILKELL